VIGTIALSALGAVMIACGIAVVRARDLVHAVFWLAAMLIATAGLFVVLEAPFLAGIQIVLYTGGVITLMLFGVMLTHRDLDAAIPNPVAHELRAGITAAALGGALLFGIWTTDWDAAKPAAPVSVAQIGAHLLGPQLLAFELLSVLLLIAMIGAIALARRTDP
jgi:NADH-quinone oxidoreductase subunit J